jgi:hypothetical protein
MGWYMLYFWGPVSLLAALLVCSAASNWGFLRSTLLAAAVWVVAIPMGTIWLWEGEFEGGLQSLSILLFACNGSLIFGIGTGITLGMIHRKVL